MGTLLRALEEPTTLAVLGLGTVRDAFSATLSPGTSTIQTRLRYFIFLPWIFRRFEDRGISPDEFAHILRYDEARLIDCFRHLGANQGVIDNSAGRDLKRMPSEIYRGGLGAWGIRRLALSLSVYGKRIPALGRLRHEHGDVDGQTLFVEHPSLCPSGGVTYVASRVKIEAGARSALEPSQACRIAPFITVELLDWAFASEGIRVILPQRTYWEKLLIPRGAHCGYRDSGHLPADKDRISRHYYDVAMITATEVGCSAMVDPHLLDAVRNHNLVAFRQAWKRFEEAVPGSVRLVPQAELRVVIERDYRAMHGMILGEAPDFGWVTDQLRVAEATINGT